MFKISNSEDAVVQCALCTGCTPAAKIKEMYDKTAFE